MKLIDYINEHHNGNRAAFGRAQGIKPQQVSQWLSKDMIVSDGKLYSFRRNINKTKPL